MRIIAICFTSKIIHVAVLCRVGVQEQNAQRFAFKSRLCRGAMSGRWFLKCVVNFVRIYIVNKSETFFVLKYF